MLRVQIPFWPPADVVLSGPKFNLSATLVNNQLVCLPPVGILNLVMFTWIFIYMYHCLFHWSWKAPMKSGQLRTHTYTHTNKRKLLKDRNIKRMWQLDVSHYKGVHCTWLVPFFIQIISLVCFTSPWGLWFRVVVINSWMIKPCKHRRLQVKGNDLI